MNGGHNRPRRRPLGNQRGYLMVLFVVIVAFVGVAASMQVLILTSVGTTSRAYDVYRQGVTERVRLQRAVAEAVMDSRQVAVAPSAPSLGDALKARLAQISAGGESITPAVVPSSLPRVGTFPTYAGGPDLLAPPSEELRSQLAPELSFLVGARCAVYPEAVFEFATERTVIDVKRTYHTRVSARLVAVPLSRFPIVAYDLPNEIGATAGVPSPGPAAAIPAGLAPARDPAFLAGLQARPGVLPYQYRRRATISAAYQYVFSQAFMDRLAEYAGVTHYHSLNGGTATATLGGLVSSGATTDWDLGLAGPGTFNTVTVNGDAAVVFTSAPGMTLRVYDSVRDENAPAFFALILGPTDINAGPLTLIIDTITRPMVIIGCNVRVVARSGAVLNGALFLDPASSMAAGTTLGVGHFSYWAGTTGIPANAVVTTPMPSAAEMIVPRVVFVATTASRL